MSKEQTNSLINGPNNSTCPRDDLGVYKGVTPSPNFTRSKFPLASVSLLTEKTGSHIGLPTGNLVKVHPDLQKQQVARAAICRECSEGTAFKRDTRPNHPSAQSANECRR